MKTIEDDHKLNKFICLYEISRAITLNQTLDELGAYIVKNLSLAWNQSNSLFPFLEIHDTCFKSDRFTQALVHKFSAPIFMNGKKCGQLCFFYENIDEIDWSEEEDFPLLRNLANDLGLWLEHKNQISQQVEKLRELQIIESAINRHASLAITDNQGRINYINQQFCITSQYSENELIGQDHRIINSGFHTSEFMGNVWNTLAKGHVWKGELKNRTKDGTFFWIDATIVPIIPVQHETPLHYISIWTDVTAYKQLEEKMEMQMKELARSNDELEQFAYVVTHDLQEPLRAINSFVQLLKKYCNEKLDDRANELISHAVAGTHRMQLLIDDLLTYAQVNAHQALESVDCEKLLRNVLTDLSVIIGECKAIITYDKLPVVKGIPFQFIQLFTNLINNALKFQRELPPKIHIGVEQNLNEWIFSVSDNGIGIEEQYLERIFRVFQRLHSRREYVGTGIGLAICKKVVERHGGKIWIKSKPSVGSTIYFTIPKSN
ncbi:MAG: PAS domain-containing protein [Nitrosomonas sp.]|nr:PAS domain-containing protein [Nitrosomonas sp.]